MIIQFFQYKHNCSAISQVRHQEVFQALKDLPNHKMAGTLYALSPISNAFQKYLSIDFMLALSQTQRCCAFILLLVNLLLLFNNNCHISFYARKLQMQPTLLGYFSMKLFAYIVYQRPWFLITTRSFLAATGTTFLA